MGERKYLGPDLVRRTTEAVEKIRKRMSTAQSKQKSYADRKRRDVEFNIGDKVFLKIAPMKGAMRFRKKGKLSPRFIGPFEVLEKVGKPIEVEQDLTYAEKPVKILDRKEKELRNKKISLVKVLWRSSNIEEMTWEREDEMRSKYPELFG
ncbi:uncharacterized protein LOC133799853 [Humulus lupulus]|uniref:uncharacterized protein LOC133799853 n=1 Tax=Humulus lupulus TaxID=3486 RepID=UPI002B4066C6|nr:uncharacterized protein LOC133799853 [Humulus lupulus]